MSRTASTLRDLLKLMRSYPLLSLVFAVALLATVFFAVRLTVSTIVWANPDRYEQPIAGWMTPRYVARSWHVPPEVVGDALGLPPDAFGRRVTLDDVAREQGRPLPVVIGDVQRAIDGYSEPPRD